MIRDPHNLERGADWTREQGVGTALCDRPVRVWYRISMRIVGRPSEHLIDPLDQPLRDNVLELLGLFVDFVPLHPDDANEKGLDKPVPPQHQSREPFPGRRQTHTAVGLVLREAGFSQRLDHRRRRSWRHAQCRGHLPHRHEPLGVRQLRLADVDRFQIVLDGAGGQHQSWGPCGYYRSVKLDDRIATPEGKSRYVRSLFATIADRYDFITIALSYGQDARWKSRLVGLADPRPGDRALDLATGTGDIAFALAARNARVVGLDITPRMIELAKAKASRDQPRGLPVDFLVGDMLALPFADASFDLVTTGYGLRNVPDLAGSIMEIRRVLKTGGRLLSLDFNRPTATVARWPYLVYLTLVGGTLGWLLHGDPDTYRYIPASIRAYPGARAVVGMMEARGFARARYRPVLGGLMAIHEAVAG